MRALEEVAHRGTWSRDTMSGVAFASGWWWYNHFYDQCHVLFDDKVPAWLRERGRWPYGSAWKLERVAQGDVPTWEHGWRLYDSDG